MLTGNGPIIDGIIEVVFFLGILTALIIGYGFALACKEWVSQQWSDYQYRKGLVQCGNCSGTGLCPVCEGKKKVQP